MIQFRCKSGCEPSYQTEYSAGADLKAAEDMVIPAGKKAKVPTGVWIAKVDWENLPQGAVPELQVRARSGLAFKHGITLSNGVGTIDVDYPDEIAVLLWNTGDQDFVIQKGDRIAQMVLNLTQRLTSLPVGGKRQGGFGSTLVREEATNP